MVVPSDKREQVLKLIAEKEKIERKINQFGEILKINNIGMTEPLIDADGFPRNDIDVHQCRSARHQIICLQNDLKVLTKEIEQGLEAVHAEGAAINNLSSTKFSTQPDEQQQPQANTSINNRRSITGTTAIVKITNVLPNSPAEIAGFLVNDEVIEFGTINATNFKDVTQIASVVRHSENRSINVKIKRNKTQMELALTPKKWSGGGLLGCNIAAMESVER